MPVTIIASGCKLSIPRNFLETAQVFMGSSMIGIVTTFPGFAGATPETIAKYEPRNGFKMNDVITVVRATGDYSKYDKNRKEYIASALRLRPESDQDGLVKVPILALDIRVGLLNPSEDSVTLSCFFPNRCQAHVNLPRGLVFIYEYNDSLLPMWYQIDQGVRNLLSRFIQECQ
jgi:hypothetical protein